ncbi:2OG-Fe(II) oxygenase [Sphingobium fuliginis]|nr:2OG-Fe(II) oxygenase family protein [Sphingobium fuliginis]
MERPSFPMFKLNPDLDEAILREHFACEGRVQIADFLEAPQALALRASLSERSDWRHVINGESQVFEIAADRFDALPDETRKTLEQAMFAKASHGFQFQFDTIRVPDEKSKRQAASEHLAAFATFMSSQEVLEFIAAITGEKGIGFADAQATRYRPGDFLTRHDDAVAGKNRRLAYILGLTPGWRPDWGGLLLFHGAGENVTDIFVPHFNRLSLFAIGQPHSVSHVAPFAGAERLSVTGWLRTGRQPD